MDSWADDPSELPPDLRAFLEEPASDEAWSPSPGAGELAECEFQVKEQLLGESDARFIPEGGLRLNRVTYLPLSPQDVPAIAGYRAGLEHVRLVLAMFWFMLTELPAKRRYETVWIRIKLQPPAPVLLLRPDGPSRTGSHGVDSHSVDSPGLDSEGTGADSAGPAWQGLAAKIASAFASLPQSGSRLAATGLDHGDDGFGWKYEAQDDAPLIPQRITTLVVLELPSAAAGLAGVLDADAQISRSVLGNVFSRKATLARPAVPFQVPFEDDRGERRARPDGSGRHRQPPAGEHTGRAREDSQRSERYDLGLIVPLREEFDCAREVFSFGQQIEDRGSYLYPFAVPGSSLRGVAVVLYGMGPTSTGVHAANLLGRFEIPVLALMGIAGALDGDLRLGDVVVASLVDPYLDRAKARPGKSAEDFDLDSGGSAWRAGRNLVNFANNFRYRADERDECAEWRSRGRVRREAAGLPGDGVLARNEPEYTVAAVASGDIVGASVSFSRWLRTHHRQCAAIEMEAGGVAQAVYEHGGADMVIVRGISDFADERKSELDSTAAASPGHGATQHGATQHGATQHGASHHGVSHRGAWRRYAALNAADLLATMLRSPGFPWPS